MLLVRSREQTQHEARFHWSDCFPSSSYELGRTLKFIYLIPACGGARKSLVSFDFHFHYIFFSFWDDCVVSSQLVLTKILRSYVQNNQLTGKFFLMKTGNLSFLKKHYISL